MFFRVKKEFLWEGKLYKRGDHIDIPEGHPRLDGMHLGGFVVNDATEPSQIPKKPHSNNGADKTPVTTQRHK